MSLLPYGHRDNKLTLLIPNTLCFIVRDKLYDDSYYFYYSMFKILAPKLFEVMLVKENSFHFENSVLFQVFS